MNDQGEAHAGLAVGDGEGLGAAALRRAEQQDEREPDRERLLDHHHDARELLVGEGREPEQPHRLVDVGREERREVEQDHVGEDLAGPEDEGRVPEPLAERRAGGGATGRRSASRRAGRRRRS